jgi:hypothetical protein
LSDNITLSEGVNANGTGGALNLAFNSDFAPASAVNALLQNTPNPVVDETTIRFVLADAAAGMNTVELANTKASSVLTYTLTSGDFTISKKMVVK